LWRLGLASKAEVQLAYAIGVAEPVSVMVGQFRHCDDFPKSASPEIVRENFKLTPKGIIETLGFAAVRSTNRPRLTAISAALVLAFTWEKTDRADALRKAAGATAEVAARS
jgi:S-adenosylmethionine synthetase